MSVSLHEDFQVRSNRFRFINLQDPVLHLVGRPTTIIQDKVGFIWFAGHGGLVRYDGYDFRLYAYDSGDESSISSNYVNDVMIDASGRMWVATDTGINLYDRERDAFKRISLPNLFAGEITDQKHLRDANQVRVLLADQSGKIWLGTNVGIIHLEPETFSFSIFKTSGDLDIGRFTATAFFEEDDGSVWIGTDVMGLARYQPKTDSVSLFQHDDVDENTISSSSITQIKVDQDGDLWVGTRKGLNHFNRKTETFSRHYLNVYRTKDLQYQHVEDFWEDRNGNFWVMCNGVNLFDKHSGLHKNYRQQSYQNGKYGLHNNKAWTVYEDHHGNVWLGHFPSGVSVLDRYASSFEIYQQRPGEPNSLSNQDILSLYEDRHGNLWVGTERGLNHVNARTGEVKQYVMSDDVTSLPANAVLSVMVDSRDRVWTGTWAGGLSLLDKESDTFVNFRKNEEFSLGIDDNEVWGLYEDSRGRIWVGSDLGLARLDPDLKTYKRITNKGNPILPRQVTTIFEDKYGYYWLGGFEGLAVMRPDEKTFEYMKSDKRNEHALHSNFINTVKEIGSGQLWVSTAEGVYHYNREENNFKAYTKREGLLDDAVSNVVEDDQGALWFSSRRGLSRLDPESKEFTHYTTKTGLPGNNYRRPAGLKMQNGKLAFGSDKGLVIFDPEQLFFNENRPPVVITGFSLFNKPVDWEKQGSPLNKHIWVTEELELSHRESVFSIEYVALNYVSAADNAYAYFLEGFDKEWSYVGNQRKATYTNLDPGTYTFKVKAANNEGVWNEEGTSIRIVIRPPWWKTTWAYLCYASLIFVSAFMSYRYKLNNIELKNQREINKLKDSILANTTHELRTPLNGILGIVDTMKSELAPQESKGNSKEVIEYLNIITSSGKRLSNLINDILDSSKLQEDKLDLIKARVNLHSLVEQCFAILQFLAKEKNIILVNNIPQGISDIYVDDARFEQVLINLLSNAIKYSDGGRVIVSAEVNGDKLDIFVVDSGIGISKSDLDKLFTPFAQISAAGNKRRGGTGLGLPLTKSIVELHGGELLVESEPNRGSCFTIRLRLEEIEVREKFETKDNRVLSGRVLIVDDDGVNRLILKNLLKTFNLESDEANGGEVAIKKFEENAFDLVILDINMPGISGLETCTRIRKVNADIPIFFLSGNNAQKDRSDAESVGAQTLIAKPINKEKLKAALMSYM